MTPDVDCLGSRISTLLCATSFRAFHQKIGPIRVSKMVQIFVSYSHLDRRWIDKEYAYNIILYLARSLARLDVQIWFDHSLIPGDKFKEVIEARIDSADIAILLVSQNFLNSDFIREVELPRIEARASAGELQVIPILTGNCEWQDLKMVGSRQMLPRGPRPLIEFVGQPADWDRVQFEILLAVKQNLRRVDDARTAAARPEIGSPGRQPVSAAKELTRLHAGLQGFTRRRIIALVGLTIVAASPFGIWRADRVKRSRDARTGVQNGVTIDHVPLSANELAAIDTKLADYAAQIRERPMTAVALQSKLKTIAERFWADGRNEPAVARSAAISYRLYAASILAARSDGSVLETQNASPWIRRSLETYSSFGDQRELEAANEFFLALLINQPPDVEWEQLLQHQFRVGMVEAPQAEVDQELAFAIEIIRKIMATKEEP